MGLFSFFKKEKDTSAIPVPSLKLKDDGNIIDSITVNDPISLRDQLVLLLIAKSGINNVHKLGMNFDRSDFPGNVGNNLLTLLDRKLIFVSVANKFNNPIKYGVTEKGERFLNDEINSELIIEHVKKMSEPGFMLELVQLIFDHK